MFLLAQGSYISAVTDTVNKASNQQSSSTGTADPDQLRCLKSVSSTEPQTQNSSQYQPTKLSFLCETWTESEQLDPALGSTRLYLSRGFKKETLSVLLTEGSATDVTALESTQQEADTSHAIYSVQNEDVERVIIHGNDTDIIIICVYYATTILKDLPELWVRTATENYLPIHQMAVALGPSQCRALPFILSLSGRDTTSYPFFTGKKTWISSSKTTDISKLEDFGEQGQQDITLELIDQARKLVITVYSNKADDFEECDHEKLRVSGFSLRCANGARAPHEAFVQLIEFVVTEVVN
ncbi:PREDICTED: uncharacterized protein LOC106805038 [Priapulus caudatus]|uniref:Uncharacterized protein LOC106805038 n=1 Tax=Priapulus caudatus TaxID=37621 RepID=A0ABM1DPX4_PRICU|nr:PREDICTED: uncharacterized protein LOC106805038 [Priapulus caudatus]